MEDDILNPEIQIQYKNKSDAYNYLFLFFKEEHGLILLDSEMDDIVKAVNHFKEIYNK